MGLVDYILAVSGIGLAAMDFFLLTKLWGFVKSQDTRIEALEDQLGERPTVYIGTKQ